MLWIPIGIQIYIRICIHFNQPNVKLKTIWVPGTGTLSRKFQYAVQNTKKLLTQVTLMRKIKQCKLALLLIKIKIISWFSNLLKLEIGTIQIGIKIESLIRIRNSINMMPIHNTDNVLFNQILIFFPYFHLLADWLRTILTVSCWISQSSSFRMPDFRSAPRY